jgi:hypothetical protein
VIIFTFYVILFMILLMSPSWRQLLILIAPLLSSIVDSDCPLLSSIVDFDCPFVIFKLLYYLYL